MIVTNIIIFYTLLLSKAPLDQLRTSGVSLYLNMPPKPRRITKNQAPIQALRQPHLSVAPPPPCTYLPV